MNTLDDFLQGNRISANTWSASGCEWDTLRAIATDYEANNDLLRETAEAFARILQKFPGVHSVRWRVKDAEHLLEKIVRKKAEGSKKYADISAENYLEKVTDLVGVRALHLFKEDCFAIDNSLRDTWKPTEQPIAYVRKGDSAILRGQFEERGFRVEEHGAGYRSIHYVLPSALTLRNIYAEVQVRTLFEEGWSEIDHRVRYPNFSDNPQLLYFLDIFNRAAGSADEMGSFVRSLAESILQARNSNEQVRRERDEAIEQMDRMLDELKKAESNNAAHQTRIANLSAQVAKLHHIMGGQPHISAGVPLSFPNTLTGTSHLVPAQIALDVGRLAQTFDPITRLAQTFDPITGLVNSLPQYSAITSGTGGVGLVGRAKKDTSSS